MRSRHDRTKPGRDYPTSRNLPRVIAGSGACLLATGIATAEPIPRIGTSAELQAGCHVAMVAEAAKFGIFEGDDTTLPTEVFERALPHCDDWSGMRHTPVGSCRRRGSPRPTSSYSTACAHDCAPARRGSTECFSRREIP